MLKCKFKNCYGLKDFVMKDIPFCTAHNGNKAIIYAPNGVMKTSLAKVFQDISNKKPSKDVFFGIEGEYEIEYLDNKFTNEKLKKTDRIYVIASFDAKFKNQADSISSIIADEKLKNEYDKILSNYTIEIQSLELGLETCSGIEKSLIKNKLKEDFDFNDNEQWYSILNKLNIEIKNYESSNVLKDLKYTDIFNEKTEIILNSSNFASKVSEYVECLQSVINTSKILKNNFDVNNLDDFTKNISKNNLFEAGHEIKLSDGSFVHNIQEWTNVYQNEIKRIQESPSVTNAYKELDKLLNKNQESKTLKEILKTNKDIIPYFSNIKIFKKLLWKEYLVRDQAELKTIIENLQTNNNTIQEIIKQANNQKGQWEDVLQTFKDRFQVPFTVELENRASVMLEDELPNLVFKYKDSEHEIVKTREDLMQNLSVGEQRALYLLNIIFDISKIVKVANSDGKKRLIIIDDIADSFDYKNKYAIIEYLNEISQNNLLDLLILTHNFDFYRSVVSRLNINRERCFIVQKTQNSLKMDTMPYNKDFFKNGLFEKIKSGNITEENEKYLFASIPFFRNLYDYSGNVNKTQDLTNYLHIKDSLTENYCIQDYAEIINDYIPDFQYYGDTSNKYIDRLFSIADQISSQNDDSIYLSDKILLSMAIRLKTEMIMKRELLKIPNVNLSCTDNQTRHWYDLGINQNAFTGDQIKAFKAVNIITPENIHLNAFMYEPLIDVSMYRLITLYNQLKTL